MRCREHSVVEGTQEEKNEDIRLREVEAANEGISQEELEKFLGNRN